MNHRNEIGALATLPLRAVFPAGCNTTPVRRDGRIATSAAPGVLGMELGDAGVEMHTMRWLALLGLCAVITTACTGNQAGPGLEPGLEADSQEPGVQLTIQNETTRSLRVYVRTGGFDTP